VLLDNGGDPTLSDCTDSSPIEAAITRGDIPIIRAFIEKMGIDGKDSYGNTPLHLAAKQGLTSIIEYLMSQGADNTIKNNNGRTAAQEAQLSGHVHAATLAGRVNVANLFSNTLSKIYTFLGGS
jgi:uncharacterized protein